mmetsp:Transcript_79930/g.252680  ORF Transcript_79930/g.252680 Transcript_79930/m.252680 type:complete len:212 (+) Transcript_79930:335-970(+)
MRLSATTVFWPPESWPIARKDCAWPVKETSILTPARLPRRPGAPPAAGCAGGPWLSGSSEEGGAWRWIWSFPAPPGTISANTCRKCSFTRVSVERMADAFCSSILCKASLMQASPASISAFRRCRSASCSEKFSYCSTALRFTCWNAWRRRLTSARSRTSCGFGSCWQRLTSAAGAARRWSCPSTSALRSARAEISVPSWSTRTLSCPVCS